MLTNGYHLSAGNIWPLILVEEQRTELRFIFYMLCGFWQYAFFFWQADSAAVYGWCLISPEADTTELMPTGSDV